MRTWDNGYYLVVEVAHDHSLHAYEVYTLDGARLLGTVYPDTLAAQADCVAALDNGDDPITGGWEDGCGHTCTPYGW